MRTLGIDLAAQPRNTAACLIEWRPRHACVIGVENNLDNARLLELMCEPTVSKVGIDAPFGWPVEFVAAISAYGTAGVWPQIDRKQLAFRETDREVTRITGRTPLSVSADRIAHTAMRCAELLTLYSEQRGRVDRAGGGKIIEVYPAAALRQWGLDPDGYKGTRDPAAEEARERLLNLIRHQLDSRMIVGPETIAACVRSDHSFDALVASLVARASAIGHCPHAPAKTKAQARQEGWIHLPRQDTLNVLVADATPGTS